MLFHSYIFIFLFFPAVMLMWYGLNAAGWHRQAQFLLVGLSLVFYGYQHVSYVGIILFSIFANWCISRLIEYLDQEKKAAPHFGTAVGICGIFINIGLLFYFKYYDFFVGNINRLLHTDLALKNIALPLGISFFTFQQISFVADRMMRRTSHYKMLDYMNYVTFFPQLVAGPIVNHRDLVPQFQDIGTGLISVCKKNAGEEAPSAYLEQGIILFAAGMAKKVLLADKLGIIVDSGYADVAALDAPGAFLVMLCYTFQIYFDFSGYCDMALGLGRMLHIRLPRNFNAPYKSASIGEFWNRWHMTLNEFFTQYVYIPLGGSRNGMGKKLRNIMIVFLISGIWHGAAWTFVIWGAAHGAALCAENFNIIGRLPKKIRWFLTFSFVNLAWVLFRSPSVSAALRFYRSLFSFSTNGSIWKLTGSIADSWNYVGRILVESRWGEDALQCYYLLLALFLMLLAALLCRGKETYEWVMEKEASAGRMWLLALLFSLGVISLSGVTSFLYFNF